MKVYLLIDCYVEDCEGSPDIITDVYTSYDDAVAELKKHVDMTKKDLQDEDGIQVDCEGDFEYYGDDAIFSIYIEEKEVK